MHIIDLREAQKFLSIINPRDTKSIFQTFDDNKVKNPGLISTRVGDLQTHSDKLSELNSKGAGIFLTINESKSNRRVKTDIIRCRAIWQEDDVGTDKIPELPPSLEIETSAGKFHRYWLIRGGTTNIKLWEKVQQSLVDNWDSDPNVKDCSRVMRIPGFCHKKNGDSYRTKIISDTSNVKYYDFKDLVDYFLPKTEEKPAEKQQNKEKFDPLSAINGILSEENFHGSQISLALHYANMGMGEQEITLIIQSFFQSILNKDDRWQARYNEISKAVTSACAKINKEDVPLSANEKCEMAGENVVRGYLQLEEAPGFVHTIATNVMEFMRYPNYEIAIETALHTINTFAGNYYDYDGVPCHRKTILLAGQGVGKNTVKTFFERVCNDLLMGNGKMNVIYREFIGAGDYTGPKQMHLELQEFGSRSMISSEAGHMQSTTAGDRSGLKGYENQILASQPNAVHFPRKQNTGKGEESMKHLYSVCLSIVHESVVDNYVRLMVEGSQFTDGTVSRSSVVFIDPNINHTTKNSNNNRAIPYEEVLRVLYNISDNFLTNGDPTHMCTGLPPTLYINEDKTVQVYFDELEDFYIKERNKTQSAVHESVFTRKIVRIKQTARLLAIADSPTQPLVSMKHAKWAKHRTDSIDDTLLFHASKGVLSSGFIRLSQKFVKWTENYYSKSTRCSKVEKSKSSIYGVMFRRIFIAQNMEIINEMKTNDPACKYKSNSQIINMFVDHLEDNSYVGVYYSKKLDGTEYAGKCKYKDMKLLYV